jgi:signal transduction histidine kinase
VRDQSDKMAQARNKVAALVSIAALVLAMAGTFFWVEYEREAALDAARRYRTLSVNLHELLIAIVDAETGQRGYLLTGDDVYLEPYHAAVQTVGARLVAVEADLGDAALRVQLHDMVDAKLTELAQSVMLTQAGETREAVELMRTDRGMLLMSAIRTLVADIDARAEAEHRVAMHRRDTFTATGQVGTMAALLALALLLLVVWFAIRRDLEVMGGQQQLIREQARELAVKSQGIERALETVEEHNLALARANRELEHTARDKQRAMADLERRNEDLDQFAYVTSHDLKAPLRAIGNLTSWIEEDMPPDTSADVKENLTLVRQRVARMEKLIEGILTYSRAGRGAAQATYAPQRIDATVEDARLLLGLDEARVQVVGGALPSPGQRTEFSQVLANLISNADKHGGEGSRIFVEASCPSEGELQISVRDEGPGIDPRFHKRIFEIFQTLSPTDQVEGAGIGLAIVKKLVTGTGGKVWVESQPGQGATFIFTWPTADGLGVIEPTGSSQVSTPHPETARA